MSEVRTISAVCFVGTDTSTDRILIRKVQEAGHVTYEFTSSKEALADAACQQDGVLFVLKDFEDGTGCENSDYMELMRAKKWFCGATALIQSLSRKEQLPVRCELNFFLKSLKLCFDSSEKNMGTSKAKRYLRRIRQMGGKSKPQVVPGIDYLITPRGTSCHKYRTAVQLGIPALRIEWLDEIWNNRFNAEFDPTSRDIISRFEIKPFYELKLAFFNFKNQSEIDDMKQQTILNGGECVDHRDPHCTHIVVDAIPGDKLEHNFDTRNYPNLNKLHIVFKEWFWSSIEVSGRADEFIEHHSFPAEGCRNSSGKRNPDMSCSRMSMDGLGWNSPGLMDISFTSPLAQIKSQVDCSAPVAKPEVSEKDAPKKTKRRLICEELLEKEGNYLKILNTIETMFATPLRQQLSEPTKKPHLEKMDLDTIFGNLSPLVPVHQQIYEELEDLILINWQETNCVGRVFVKNGDALLKAYPAFVNFFEDTKEKISECEEKSSKFHAFLEVCKIKCGRQSLQDLMITPVQHLPRYQLLLEQLLKATDDKNPDKVHLKEAIEKIKQVNKCINEAKRKTEGYEAMLGLVHEIEDVPPELLSAQRQLCLKTDAKLVLADNANSPVLYKGHTLTVFLFTDCIEICKKRTVKRSDSITSRSSGKSVKSTTTSKDGKKPYKHVELVWFKDIKSFHDFDEPENGFHGAVWISTIQHSTDGRMFKHFPLVLMSDREKFVSEFSKNFTKHNPTGDIIKGQPRDKDFKYAEYLVSSLSKSSFGKATEKLCRKMSMNRRQSISQANLMPQFFSRTATQPSPSTNDNNNCSNSNNLLPPPAAIPPTHLSTVPRPRIRSRFLTTISSSFLGSPLSGRRISSSSLCLNDLNEFDEKTHDDTFSLPSTPAPRKKMCPTSVPTTPTF